MSGDAKDAADAAWDEVATSLIAADPHLKKVRALREAVRAEIRAAAEAEPAKKVMATGARREEG